MHQNPVLTIRMDGEYLAHEVMRRALRDIVERSVTEPYSYTVEDGVYIASLALAVVDDLEGGTKQ